jgi:kynurenine formamidase
MPRHEDGSWTPPQYQVDANGKVVGYVNTRTPNNWGRWGELDERGTTNFITSEMIVDATRLVKTGRPYSLAIPLDRYGPVHPARAGGVVHQFSWTGSDAVIGGALTSSIPGGFQGSDDYIFMPLQGSTQWDALCHYSFDDCIYNGFWVANTESFAGARRLSISEQKDRLNGRGVLLDVAGHLGVKRLEPGFAITPDHLDACAKAQGVRVGTGDIVLVRTGYLGWWYELAMPDRHKFWDASPGLSIDTADWIHQHEIAALAADNGAVEVEPFEDPDAIYYPLHARLIRDLGLTIGEVWWLDDLAEACGAEKRWEFFLCAAPLNVSNGAGTPLNPIAIL